MNGGNISQTDVVTVDHGEEDVPPSNGLRQLSAVNDEILSQTDAITVDKHLEASVDLGVSSQSKLVKKAPNTDTNSANEKGDVADLSGCKNIFELRDTANDEIDVPNTEYARPLTRSQSKLGEVDVPNTAAIFLSPTSLLESSKKEQKGSMHTGKVSRRLTCSQSKLGGIMNGELITHKSNDPIKDQPEVFPTDRQNNLFNDQPEGELTEEFAGWKVL